MRKKIFFLIGLGLTSTLLAQELATDPVELPTEPVELVPAPVEPPPGSLEMPTDSSAVDFLLEETLVAAVTQELAVAVSETNQAMNAELGFLADIGNQYVAEEEYEEAERVYLRALEEDPENPAIRFRLSTLYLLMDRYTEAVPILEELVAKYPENSEIRNNLAWVYATGTGVKDKTKALRNAREALLSAPFSPSIWNTLAEAYYIAGDYDRALRSAKHAMYLLGLTDPDPEKVEAFQSQRQKILRAQQAFKRLEGLNDDE